MTGATLVSAAWPRATGPHPSRAGQARPLLNAAPHGWHLTAWQSLRRGDSTTSNGDDGAGLNPQRLRSAEVGTAPGLVMALAGDLLSAVRAKPSRAMHIVLVLFAGLDSRVHASGHRRLPALAPGCILGGD